MSQYFIVMYFSLRLFQVKNLSIKGFELMISYFDQDINQPDTFVLFAVRVQWDMKLLYSRVSHTSGIKFL